MDRVESLIARMKIAIEKREHETGREFTREEIAFFSLGFNDGLFAYDEDAKHRFNLYK